MTGKVAPRTGYLAEEVCFSELDLVPRNGNQGECVALD